MAKRFFNNQRIEEDWYISLSCKHRELLRYCESKCDGAGIFSWNAKIATTYIGERVSDVDLLAIPVTKLPNGKYFIRGFCFFQNGKLSEKSPAHIPIFKSLKENEIDESVLLCTLPHTLQSRVQEREREKEQEKDKDKEVIQPKIEKSELEIAFDNWIEMRKKMKGGISDHAIELGKSELKKLADGNVNLAIEIINQSILNSWKGFFQIKNVNNGIKKTGHDIEASLDLADRILRGEITDPNFTGYQK